MSTRDINKKHEFVSKIENGAENIVKKLTNRGKKIGVHHLFFIKCANKHYHCSYKHS